MTIKPYLVLVDKDKVAGIDNVPGLFELVHRTTADGDRRLQTACYIGSVAQLSDLDLMTEVDVSAEVALLREEVEEAARRFESLLDAPLAAYDAAAERGSKCRDCEFQADGRDERSGFVECWGPLSQPKPHMLELLHVGTARAPDRSSLAEWMIGRGKASLVEIPQEGLVTKDGVIGPLAERQRRQIEYTRRNEIYIGPRLRPRIEGLRAWSTS